MQYGLTTALRTDIITRSTGVSNSVEQSNALLKRESLVRIQPNPLEIYSPNHSLIAQLAEHEAVNFGVPGSSPGGGACPCSSVVEQWFCKPLVVRSNRIGGS